MVVNKIVQTLLDPILVPVRKDFGFTKITDCAMVYFFVSVNSQDMQD